MTLRNFLSFLCLLFTAYCAQAQHYNNEQINWFQQFSQSHSSGKRVEKALKHIEDEITRSITDQNVLELSRLNKEKGLLHLRSLHDYNRAMDCFITSLKIEDSLSLNENKIFTFVAIAEVFEEGGDYSKSATYLERALELNQKQPDTELLVWITTKQGKINIEQRKLDEAIKNYNLVLERNVDLNNKHVEAETLESIARIYELQGSLNEALKHDKQALKIKRSIGDRKGEARSLNNIAALYAKMNNYDKALANNLVALDIWRQLKDKRGLATIYNQVGAAYYNQKNLERAVANLFLALEAANESQAQEQIRSSYEYLALCYKEAGDFKKAFEYKELYLALDALIQNEKNETLLIDSPERYELSLKEAQIEALEDDRREKEKELRTQRKISNFLFAVIVLSIIIVLLILYLYILKQRSNKVLQAAHQKVNEQNIELQEANATKDKFFSIISHDLKGPLNSLTSFSGLLINHTESLSKDEIKMLAQDLDKSLKNLFTLLENLLEWSRSQTGNIEFKPEVFDMNELLETNKQLLQAQAANKNIAIVNNYGKALKISAHKNSINTVIRNLISNAIKFTPRGGTITLELTKESNNVRVSVSDNGVGMSEDIKSKLFRIDTKVTTKGTSDEKGTGLGLILCKEFIEKNGGKIGVESEEGRGSTFYFTLPQSLSQLTIPVQEWLVSK